MEPEFWQAVLDADGAVPEGYTAAELTPELLGYLGSTDPFLRDEVAFEVLAAWLARDGRYSADEQRAIGNRLAHNLTIGLGQQGDDSIFLRSFSALVLDKVIEADNWRPALDEADIRRWMEQGLAYFGAERDGRGLVPGKGWAHAVAHAADLLWVLAQSRYLAAAGLARLLDAIAAKLTAPTEYVYLYGEDQRLAYAVVTILLRDLLDLPALESWLNRMTRLAGHDWSNTSATNAYHNTTTFLRSLYFQLLFGIKPPSWYTDTALYQRTPPLRDALLPIIAGALKRLDRGFYAQEP
jgi:hypothetical protein